VLFFDALELEHVLTYKAYAIYNIAFYLFIYFIFAYSENRCWLDLFGLVNSSTNNATQFLNIPT